MNNFIQRKIILFVLFLFSAISIQQNLFAMKHHIKKRFQQEQSKQLPPKKRCCKNLQGQQAMEDAASTNPAPTPSLTNLDDSNYFSKDYKSLPIRGEEEEKNAQSILERILFSLNHNNGFLDVNTQSQLEQIKTLQQLPQGPLSYFLFFLANLYEPNQTILTPENGEEATYFLSNMCTAYCGCEEFNNVLLPIAQEFNNNEESYGKLKLILKILKILGANIQNKTGIKDQTPLHRLAARRTTTKLIPTFIESFQNQAAECFFHTQDKNQNTPQLLLQKNAKFMYENATELAQQYPFFNDPIVCPQLPD